MIRGIAFDFDGVLVESVDVKTKAYARLFEEHGEGVVSRVVDYHLTNGGISRFVKFRIIYSEILNKPLSEKKFQSLCDEFSHVVVLVIFVYFPVFPMFYFYTLHSFPRISFFPA